MANISFEEVIQNQDVQELISMAPQAIIGLVQAMFAGGKTTAFKSSVPINVPLGTSLRIMVNEIDDDATVSMENNRAQAGFNKNIDVTWDVTASKNNPLVFTITNTKAHQWKIAIQVVRTDTGKTILNYVDGGNDRFWFGRTRMYIFQINATP